MGSWSWPPTIASNACRATFSTGGRSISAFAGADVVFHTAAVVSIDRSQADEVATTNVRGTHNVVEAALECGVKRLIHFSSIHAFNHFPLEEPLDESRGPAGGPHASSYELSKVGGEREVRRGIDKGLDAVILNPTGVVGPPDLRPSHMGQFFLDLYHRKLPALVAGGYDWVDVRDVAAAALSAETRGRSGARYILAGGWHTMREVSRLARQVTGVAAPRMTLPRPVARAWAPFQIAWDRLHGRRPLYHCGCHHHARQCQHADLKREGAGRTRIPLATAGRLDPGHLRLVRRTRLPRPRPR